MSGRPSRAAVADRIAVRQELWRKGNLRYLCDTGKPKTDTCSICVQKHVGQLGVYDAIKAAPGERFYLEFSRRRGKTFFLCILAIEYAISHPNAQIHYAAGTVKAVKKMVRPNMRRILRDCPDELRPKWNGLDSEFVFPNGSVITVAGCDSGNYENLRGTESHLVIVDEAGFIDELDAVLDDVLMPMTLETGATVIISSTPPRSLDHYAAKIAAECQKSGRLFHQTIYDNPRLTDSQVENYIRKAAGSRDVGAFKRSTTFRREFLAERIADANAMVVPEWIDQAAHLVWEPAEHPPFRDTYVSMDIGFRDGWGVLFAYWDFKAALLIIEDELLFFGQKTNVVAAAIKDKEKQLWGDHKVYRRISDNDLLTIADLSEHKLYFSATAKDDKENQVNRIREWVAAGKIVVSPRCVNLIAQLAKTVWNERRDDYIRTDEGHGDLLDALIYLGRNIDRQRNPYPVDNSVPDNMYVVRRQNNQSAEGATVLQMVGLRSRRR